MGEKKRFIELNWSSKNSNPSRVSSDDLNNLVEEKEFYQDGSASKDFNALFWGDNQLAMEYLLKNGYEGKIDLIYLDPPFFTGLNFSARNSAGKRKPAYRDKWDEGLSQYLTYMYDRIELLHDLLKDNGTIYIHLDWHVSHYIKIIMDEIFGYDNFHNQLIWKRLTYKQTQVKGYGVLHDVILYYTKGKDFTWNDVRVGYDDERLKKYFCWLETRDGENQRLSKAQLNGEDSIPEGRRFALNPIINPNPDRPNLTYEFCGMTKVWKYTKEKMQDYHEKGIVFQPSPGRLPQKKQYLDESKGMKLNDIILDIGAVMGGSLERLGYDTQKPEQLLARLIEASSNPGDVVADFFCGSGTTLAVAEKLKRRWIGCDISKNAIQTTRKRLYNITSSKHPHKKGKTYDEKVKPFKIYKLNHQDIHYLKKNHQDYIMLVLKLYGAKKIDDFGSINGIKGGEHVYINNLNDPVDSRKLKEIVGECKGFNVEKLHILGDKWCLELNFDTSEYSKKMGITLKCIQTPHVNGILAGLVGNEKNVKNIVDINDIEKILKFNTFFPIPDIYIETKLENKCIKLKLTDLNLNNPEMSLNKDKEPEDSRDFIDQWFIDWNFDGNIFKPTWQSFKTKHVPYVDYEASHEYHSKDKHRICIKIIDIFGNESIRVHHNSF
ncbi:MAG: site-specific DNA-methyltransferase [Candidatus Hodarchaeota archaeon]